MGYNDFNTQSDQNGMAGWIRWLYLIVGCFIVCLLIWMFMALSKHQIKQEEYENEVFPLEQTDSINPGISSPL